MQKQEVEPCFSCESRIRFTRGKQPNMLVSTAEKEQIRQDDTRGFFTMNIDATDEQIVVIVGAGFAGGNAAVTLREEGWRGRIVLLGAEPGIPFGRPPLSKTYLRGEEDLSAWHV